MFVDLLTWQAKAILSSCGWRKTGHTLESCHWCPGGDSETAPRKRIPTDVFCAKEPRTHCSQSLQNRLCPAPQKPANAGASGRHCNLSSEWRGQGFDTWVHGITRKVVVLVWFCLLLFLPNFILDHFGTPSGHGLLRSKRKVENACFVWIRAAESCFADVPSLKGSVPLPTIPPISRPSRRSSVWIPDTRNQNIRHRRIGEVDVGYGSPETV